MGFRVIASSVPASTEDWRRAMTVSTAELPPLSADQLAEVKRLSLDEEEYKRLRVLLRQYSFDRQEEHGKRFGAFVESVLEPLGDRYRLAAVSRRGSPLGWRVTIRQENKGVYEVQCPLEVVDAVALGDASERDLECLRRSLLTELGVEMSLGAAS